LDRDHVSTCLKARFIVSRNTGTNELRLLGVFYPAGVQR
jgi:hypothetical protein